MYEQIFRGFRYSNGLGNQLNVYRKGGIEGRDESLIALLFHGWIGVTEERGEGKEYDPRETKNGI